MRISDWMSDVCSADRTDTSWNGSFIGFTVSEIRRVRTSKSHRHTETFGIPHHHVCAERRRWFQQRKTHQIRNYADLDILLMAFLRKISIIMNLAIPCRILNNCSEYSPV